MSRPLSTNARAQMLAAAADIVVSDGMSKLSIDEVARQSGVAKTTIYRHFSGKNELVVAALDDMLTATVEDPPDTGTLRGDLIEFLKVVLPNFANRRLQLLYLEMMVARAHDAELHELSESMMTGRGLTLFAIIGRARDRGEIDAELDAISAFAFVEGPLVLRSLAFPEGLAALDVESYVDRILGTLR